MSPTLRRDAAATGIGLKGFRPASKARASTFLVMVVVLGLILLRVTLEITGGKAPAMPAEWNSGEHTAQVSRHGTRSFGGLRLAIHADTWAVHSAPQPLRAASS